MGLVRVSEEDGTEPLVQQQFREENRGVLAISAAVSERLDGAASEEGSRPVPPARARNSRRDRMGSPTDVQPLEVAARPGLQLLSAVGPIRVEIRITGRII